MIFWINSYISLSMQLYLYKKLTFYLFYIVLSCRFLQVAWQQSLWVVWSVLPQTCQGRPHLMFFPSLLWPSPNRPSTVHHLPLHPRRKQNLLLVQSWTYRRRTYLLQPSLWALSYLQRDHPRHQAVSKWPMLTNVCRWWRRKLQPNYRKKGHF